MPGVEAWSPRSPRLYELELRLFTAEDGASPMDDLIERVGFRTVTTKKGRIQINGEDIVLQGFNRHEDHPLVGAAFPLPLMAKDLDLMADMGANSVRTSHYPNDERFLDLCDERGFCVWEENHARGLSLEQMRNPNFIRQCEQVNKEMVLQHGNHPSIVIWAILNECASDTEEGRVHYKRQLEQIRALDRDPAAHLRLSSPGQGALLRSCRHRLVQPVPRVVWKRGSRRAVRPGEKLGRCGRGSR
ncbi:hypothetical protein LJK87_41940 [Paenibacillus sp. P25]|nr:hypothetical protein LJK87_41940 [Paenibacillus sp. P25]